MNIPFYPADKSNYTKGRGGKKIKKIMFHHTAGMESTLRHLWSNPSRNGSSTYFVGQGYSEQYVDEADTPWTNGNFPSNQESITIEVRGDWRFGYRDELTLSTVVELVRDIRSRIPDIGYGRHREVSDKPTICSADLPCEEIWARSNPKAATLSVITGVSTDIPDKKVILTKDANVWDMSFTKYSSAKAVTALPAGTVIDVAGIYQHPLGSSYYLSSYSWERGLNNGINIKDTEDFVEPTPPVVEPTPEPVEVPTPEIVVEPTPKPTSGAGELPTLPVDPNGDKINEILLIVRWIKEQIERITK